MSGDRINKVLDKFWDDQGLDVLFKDVNKEKEAVNRAVDKAYRDACRPLHDIDTQSEKRDKALVKIKDVVCNKLNKGCIKKEDFKECREAWTNSELDEKYKSEGIAQKIVNMTFKYLLI